MGDQAVSVGQLAKQWGVAPKTVTRLIEVGKLKGHKIVRVWRVFESDLQDFLARNVHDPQVVKMDPATPDFVKGTPGAGGGRPT